MSKSSDEELNGLLMVFALLTAGRAFILVTAVDILQTPLPSFSIFLIAAITSNGHLYPYTHVSPLDRAPLTLVCFLLLCLSTLYLFCHEQSQRWFATHTPLRFQRQLLLWVALFSVLTVPVVLVIGWSLQPFNMLNLAGHLQNRRPIAWHLPFMTPEHSAFSVDDRLDMLHTSWSRGKQKMMTVTVRGKFQNLLWRAETFAYYDAPARQWLPAAQAPEATADRLPEYATEQPWRTRQQNGVRMDTFRTESPCSDPGLVEAMHEHLMNADVEQSDARVVQTFNLQAEVLGDREPIYGLYQICQVSPTGASGVGSVTPYPLPRWNAPLQEMTRGEDGSVLLKAPAAQLRSYQVVSLVKPMPMMLRLARDPVLRDRPRYLQLPQSVAKLPGMPSSSYAHLVRRKALEMLAENNLTAQSGAFEVVRQFEVSLGRHYRYTLTPDPPKTGIDPILNFLFHQQQGYCTYFSGAMVLLCRSVGLPARMVTGYATGEQIDNASNSEDTSYQVTSDDAHCWVEVFLPHYGWYISDPTAGSKPVSSVLGDSWDVLVSFFSNAKALVSTVITALRRHAAARTGALLIALALAALAAGILYLLRERPPTFPRRALSDAEARRAVLASYQRMHRWLRRWGVSKPAGITALEFESLFRTLNPPMGELVGQLTRLYLRGQYGARTLRDADAREAITLLHALWRLAPSERKHFYAASVE